MPKLKNKSIIVFTGGGLAPALNATLYGIIKNAKKESMNVFGGTNGWASLLGEAKIIDLTKINIESIKARGGTFLRSSRTNPLTVKDGIEKIKKTLKKYNIDYVVAIGGDDTLGASYKLSNKKYNLKIVGIPKTIDNDLSATYFTPGFPTAAHKLSQIIKEIKNDAAYSLSRIFVIETYGMKAGWITASAAYGDADVILPPEKTYSLKKTLDIIKSRYEKNGKFAVVVVSQEACFNKGICALPVNRNDQYSHKRQHFICLSLCQAINDGLGITTVPLYPGNLLQTGNPIDIDRNSAYRLGAKAIQLIKQEKFGYMASLKRSKNIIKTSQVPLAKAVGKYNMLDDTLFDFKNLKVKKKFLNYMEPILGKQKLQDNNYSKLISKIK